MSDTKNFGDAAQRLARNPLGIIALFIVLVYGLAALVTALGGSMSPSERLPLVYFLVVFPVLVLGVFAWLVGKHSNKLFSPQDFQDEENYVKLLSATASLTAASVKSGDDGPTEAAVSELVRTMRESASGLWSQPFHADRVLWVDDRPENNVHERRALEAMGLSFTLSLSTADALEQLSRRQFAAIISDMGRKEGAREGYALLAEVRETDGRTPFFIYAGAKSAEFEREALDRGAQGNTNDPQELFRMVMRAVVRRQAAEGSTPSAR